MDPWYKFLVQRSGLVMLELPELSRIYTLSNSQTVGVSPKEGFLFCDNS